MATDDFADAVKHSDNYYVIVTRESLPALPYSVDEIYGIKSSGKYGTLQKTYQEFSKCKRKVISKIPKKSEPAIRLPM